MRNPGIDLLRGLSIVLVVIHHVAIRIPLRKTALASFVPRRILDALAFNGYEAVFVFFVISGFLITLRWMEKLEVTAFYARRAARILPCLGALVVILCAMHLAHVPDFTITRGTQTLPRTVIAALGLHLNWYEGRTGWLPGAWDVLWSLSIEEVFYLAFPIVCVTLGRTRLFVPCLLLLALSLPWTRAALAGNEIWQEKAYLPGMAAIATGVLAALFVRGRRVPQRWIVRAALCAGAAGLVAALAIEDLLWKPLGNGEMLVLTGSAALLVVGCHWAPRAIPGTGWLRSFGRLSYECYLTHMFAVFAVVRLFKSSGSALAHGYLWYPPVLALSWLCGAAVARWFSVPAERLLLNRPLSRSSRAPAASCPP